MSDEVEIYVTLFKGEDDELRLKLHLPGDGWTYEEAKLAKRVSEGMTPAAIEGTLLEGDPDAWMAVLRVSFLRSEIEFPPRVAGEDIYALMREIGEQTREALRRRPPTNPSASGTTESSEPVRSEPATPSPA